MLCLHHPQGLARIRRGHVVVQPDRRRCPFVSESNHEFTTARALHMNVRRLVFARRCVEVDAEGTFVVHLYHGANLKPSVGLCPAPLWTPWGGVPNPGLDLTGQAAWVRGVRLAAHAPARHSAPAGQPQSVRRQRRCARVASPVWFGVEARISPLETGAVMDPQVNPSQIMQVGSGFWASKVHPGWCRAARTSAARSLPGFADISS